MPLAGDPSQLTEDQRIRLRGALVGVFPQDELDLIVRDSFPAPNNRLDLFVPVAGRLYELIVDDLLFRAQAENLIEALVRGMLIRRPNNRTFLELAADVGIAVVAAAVQPAKPPEANKAVIRDRVTRFNAGYRSKKETFDYLKAYKQLHDSVHKLQDRLPALHAAAERARRQQPDRAGLRVIAIQLMAPVALAQAGNMAAEFPDENAAWVQEFARAVADLRGTADGQGLSRLDAAIETLEALPNRQSELNAELVRLAKRLKPEQLISMIDDVLAELRSPDAPEATIRLKAGLELFRTLCTEAGQLLSIHDHCQKVDTALKAIRRPADIVGIPRNDASMSVRARLELICKARPQDELAVIAAASAGKIEADVGSATGNPDENAARVLLDDAEDQYSQLSASFGQMFIAIDQQLLEVTSGLVSQVSTLDALMTGFI